MTVLLLMPVQNGQNVLFRSLDALKLLDPQPDGYVFLDDWSTDESLLILETFKVGVKTAVLRNPFPPMPTHPDMFVNVAFAREHLMAFARSVNADSVLMMSQDIEIVTPNALTLLSENPADIVVGVAPMESLPPDTQMLARMLNCNSAYGADLVLIKHEPLYDDRLHFFPRTNITVPEDMEYFRAAVKLGYTLKFEAGVKGIHHFELRTPRHWDHRILRLSDILLPTPEGDGRT